MFLRDIRNLESAMSLIKALKMLGSDSRLYLHVKVTRIVKQYRRTPIYVHFIALCAMMKLCTPSQEKGEGGISQFYDATTLTTAASVVKYSYFDPTAGLSPFVGCT
jgi:hypothetical protein